MYGVKLLKVLRVEDTNFTSDNMNCLYNTRINKRFWFLDGIMQGARVTGPDHAYLVNEHDVP
jgi:hypothetical protein